MTQAVQVQQFTNDQLTLVRQTVAKGTTAEQFSLFIEVCKYHNLNPFARQIYAVVRGTQMTIQTSIDGYRLLAERSGKYAGQLGPEWCGDDGIWKDVWLSDKPPVAARVGVLRKDFPQPTWGVAKYKSYAQSTPIWNKMADTMLAKCAESLALRKAFPAEMSGIYTSEEMQQADHDLPTVDTFTGTTTVEADPAPASTPPAPRNIRTKPASQPAPQQNEQSLTDEQAQAKATDQQKASIRKLCQHVSMSVPDLDSMSFIDAKALIAELTAEYKKQRNENQAQPAPAQPKITPQQAERIRNLCKALGENEPAGLAELAYFDAKALYEQLAAKYKAQKQATPQTATGPNAPIQDKATAAMVNKAKSRVESLDMLWGDIKRDALGGQIDDKDLTVAQYAKINSVIETYEQKKAS